MHGRQNCAQFVKNNEERKIKESIGLLGQIRFIDHIGLVRNSDGP